MAIVALNCPNCGGPVQKEDKNCKYCQASINFSPDYKQVKLVGFPCPKCGNPAEKGDRFCSKCAAGLVVKCPSCRHDVSLGSIFCPNCRTNFAVAKLIEEANQKKRVINESYAGKEKGLYAEKDNVIQSYRDSVTKDAEGLISQSKGMGDQKWAINAGYIGVFILGWLSFAATKSFKGDAACGVGILAIIVGYVLLLFFYPPIAKAKQQKELFAKAADMKKDESWKKYLPENRKSAIVQKEKETADNKVKLDAARDQELKDTDEWLESTVSTMHS